VNDLVVVRAALLPSRRHLLLKYLSFCRCCNKLSLLLLSLIQEYLLEVCFGVKLDKLLLDKSHKRVKKDKEKNFKKKTKIFSLSSVSSFSNISSLSSALLLFREEEEEVKEEGEEGEEHRRTTKNHLISSSRTTTKRAQTRQK
jgi:hypothetical protein